MSILPKELENLSADVLRAALKVKEEIEKTTLYKDIASLEEQILGKKSLLASLTGSVETVKSKRGRKKGSKAKAGKTGTRDTSVKEKVLSFLTSKGKEGAHVDAIVKATGKTKAQINAFLATTGKKSGVKGKGKRSGIYIFVK